jgi:hypothetical protein
MLIEDGYVHSLRALLQKIDADDGARSGWTRAAASDSITQRIYRSISNLDQVMRSWTSGIARHDGDSGGLA